MSAARLAAEAAFATFPSSEPRGTPASTAQVTVRRARLAAAAPVLATAAGHRSDEQPAGEKSPRVFIIPAAPAAATTAGLPMQQGLATTETSRSSGTQQRKRRVAAEKRPGQVVVLMSATPRTVSTPLAPAPGWASLNAAMVGLTPLLEAISHAQSLQFIDQSRAHEWQRLAQRAEELMRQLRPARP